MNNSSALDENSTKRSLAVESVLKMRRDGKQVKTVVNVSTETKNAKDEAISKGFRWVDEFHRARRKQDKMDTRPL